MTKRWLAAFAIALAAVSLPARAWAKDATTYALVAEGDLQAARASVLEALGEDLSAEDRAASMELMVVIERWSTAGTRPFARVATAEAPIAEPDDWHASFSAARDALVGGRYRAAAARFATLSRSAPDGTTRARAEALARLSQAIAMHDGSPSARQVAEPSSPAPASADTPESKKKEWYGWQTLICDGASVVTAPIGIGIGGYVLCAPIVHFAHGQPLAGIGSLGLRLGAPLGLAIAGGVLEGGVSSGRCEMGCGVAGAAVGFVLGLATAISLDAALLARKEVKSTEKRPTVVPTGSAQSGRIEFGLAGTF